MTGADEKYVTVKYMSEAGTWSATVDGWRWSATARNLVQCRKRVKEALPVCVDERRVARSLMFVGVHSPMLRITPHASEVFELYAPDVDQETAR